MARGDERDPRGHDPPALVVRRGGLPGPGADADPGHPGPAGGGDPRLQARALLGRGRCRSTPSRTDRGCTRVVTTPAPTLGSRAGRRPSRSWPPVAARPAEITKLEKSERKERAPLLYDLTSLQRDANTRFGFTARRTLAAAQRLYEEHKALTYPRTNSRYLTGDMIRRSSRSPGWSAGSPSMRRPPSTCSGLSPPAGPGGQRLEGHRPSRDHPDQRRAPSGGQDERGRPADL